MHIDILIINKTGATSRTETSYAPGAFQILHSAFSLVDDGQSLVFCVMLCWQLFVILSFSVVHCIVCTSIYGFRLPPFFDIFTLSLVWYKTEIFIASKCNCAWCYRPISLNSNHSVIHSTLSLLQLGGEGN